MLDIEIECLTNRYLKGRWNELGSWRNAKFTYLFPNCKCHYHVFFFIDITFFISFFSGTMNQMSLGHKEGPSVFECQLKIFSKWYQSWAPSDRTEFVIQLNSSNPEFISYINSQTKTSLSSWCFWGKNRKCTYSRGS